jgi:hypothetical protein
MATVCVRPPPLTVTVAVRVFSVVLAAAVMLTVLLFVPDAGETLTQASEPAAVQLVFDCIVISCEPPSAAISTSVAETVRVGVMPTAGCVTRIVRVMPPPLKQR